MGALFVTGTDTGVGKTFVGCALAHAWRAAGRTVGVVKPVETGVEGEPADARALAHAAGDRSPLDDVCPYRFRASLAPAVAAALEDRTVDVDRIAGLIERRAGTDDVLLVEGAGGLLVPITGTTTWLDLVVRVRLPMLLVAANRLGTVNHTALTARVAASAGVTIVGFVLSQPVAVTDVSAESNAETIAALTGLRCLGVLPHLDRPDRAAARLTLPSIG
jgi:dethiobiotin synthetase